jgi:CubicO group peptidase (beta-lactamase class C family)
MSKSISVLCTIAVSVILSSAASAQQDTSLVGLWYAKRWFGPDVKGDLIVQRNGARWQASIGSRAADVRVSHDSVSFELPSAATFKGHIVRNGVELVGQWIDRNRRIAMPLRLTSCGAGCYSTRLQPQEDTFTFYMNVKPRADGKLGAFLRNPERNQGRFIRLDHLVKKGDTVFFQDARDTTITRGLLNNVGQLSAYLRFNTYDFEKLPPDSFTYFYPRGRPTGTYTYAVPRQKNDGWTVTRARDVGLSEERLGAMVRKLVNSSVDSTNAFRLHGILVARHGKLVLEEYFFGEHGDKPHDTRSASKTLVSLVLGAAMQHGMNVSPDMPVYATMGLTSPSLDPRKRTMKLHHLLTMSSGLDCDDGADEYHEGSEDNLTNQDTIPDWLSVVLRLNLIRDPGAKGVYCSINPYFAGEGIAQATGKSFPDLAWQLIGEPLQMARSTVVLDPFGRSYLGGGLRFLPRDFLKMAQVYANGGTWNGKRIVSEAWVRESSQPRYLMSNQIDTDWVARSALNYGYLWWSTQYKYRGKIIRAYHMSGNGGQYNMFIPDLDIVIGAWGGNYADRGGFAALTQLIPQEILTAIEK